MWCHCAVWAFVTGSRAWIKMPRLYVSSTSLPQTSMTLRQRRSISITMAFVPSGFLAGFPAMLVNSDKALPCSAAELAE